MTSTLNIINEQLRMFRLMYKKDPDLIVFNKPTFYELYPKYIGDSDSTFAWIKFLVNEKTRTDVSLYMFNDKQELVLGTSMVFENI